MRAVLLVSFGGPRNILEITPFLQELLCDQDVIHSPFPPILHTLLFKRVAKKRAHLVKKEYEEMGGKSPLFEEIEELAKRMQIISGHQVIPFHRYLPSTHSATLEALEALSVKQIDVLPLFPQFSYTTTGSSARFFQRHLSPQTRKKLKWLPSYSTHPVFLEIWKELIQAKMQECSFEERETLFLFSAHGLPHSYIREGDPYLKECKATFFALMRDFREAEGVLAFQSQFGKEEWIAPSTGALCEKGLFGRKKLLFIPISFTSDHLETLVEIEKVYLPLLEKKGYRVERVSACQAHPKWPSALSTLLQESFSTETQSIVRKRKGALCNNLFS